MGGIYKTRDGKRWLEYAAWEIKSAFKKFEGPVVIIANVYFSNKRRRDLDNMTKIIGDSVIASGVIPDDNWQIVRRWELEAFEGKDRIELEIVNYVP
jgi:Holliday junction resolvase RusA-like endonuclease